MERKALKAGRRLQAKHTEAAIYGKRIGYSAVFNIGGTLARTTPFIELNCQ
jgi:hypothetical protein